MILELSGFTDLLSLGRGVAVRMVEVDVFDKRGGHDFVGKPEVHKEHVALPRVLNLDLLIVN